MVTVTSSVWWEWRKAGIDNIGLLIKTRALDAMELVDPACEVWAADHDHDNEPSDAAFRTASMYLGDAELALCAGVDADQGYDW